jgi:hypothetical protein
MAMEQRECLSVMCTNTNFQPWFTVRIKHSAHFEPVNLSNNYTVLNHHLCATTFDQLAQRKM